MSSQLPSVDELRAVCQPAGIMERGSAEHWAGRLYMRKISIHATRVALRLGLSANSLTAGMILVGLLGAGMLALPGLWPAVAAAVLIQLYLLLDCSDGEVARWNRATSAKGVFLDRVGHYLVEAALVVGLGLRSSSDSVMWVSLGLVGAILVILIKAVADISVVARIGAGLPEQAEADRVDGKRLGSLRSVARKFPVHRAIGAIELSLLAVGAAIADSVVASTLYTRALLAFVAGIALLVFALRLASILSSNRLGQ